MQGWAGLTLKWPQSNERSGKMKGRRLCWLWRENRVTLSCVATQSTWGKVNDTQFKWRASKYEEQKKAFSKSSYPCDLNLHSFLQGQCSTLAVNTSSLMVQRFSDANGINTAASCQMIASPLTDCALRAAFRWWPLAPETWSLELTEPVWDQWRGVHVIVRAGVILLGFTTEPTRRRDCQGGTEGTAAPMLWKRWDVDVLWCLILWAHRAPQAVPGFIAAVFEQECCGCRCAWSHSSNRWALLSVNSKNDKSHMTAVLGAGWCGSIISFRDRHPQWLKLIQKIDLQYSSEITC